MSTVFWYKVSQTVYMQMHKIQWNKLLVFVSGSVLYSNTLSVHLWVWLTFALKLHVCTLLNQLYLCYIYAVVFYVYPSLAGNAPVICIPGPPGTLRGLSAGI